MSPNALLTSIEWRRHAEAWHSLTENIKPKAIFRLCLIQTEAKLAFVLLGGYFGVLTHREPLLRTYFPIPPCFRAPFQTCGAAPGRARAGKYTTGRATKCCKLQRRAPMLKNAGTQSGVNYRCGHRRASVMKSAGTQSAVNYRCGHPCSKTRAPKVL